MHIAQFILLILTSILIQIAFYQHHIIECQRCPSISDQNRIPTFKRFSRTSSNRLRLDFLKPLDGFNDNYTIIFFLRQKDTNQNIFNDYNSTESYSSLSSSSDYNSDFVIFSRPLSTKTGVKYTVSGIVTYAKVGSQTQCFNYENDHIYVVPFPGFN